MAQSAKRPTLDFGSGHEFTVHGFEPCVGLCTDCLEPAWDSLSLSLSLSLLLFLPTLPPCVRPWKTTPTLAPHDGQGKHLGQLRLRVHIYGRQASRFDFS